MAWSSRPSSHLATLSLIVAACGPLPPAEPSVAAAASPALESRAAPPVLETPRPPPADALAAAVARPAPTASSPAPDTHDEAEEPVDFEEQGDLPAAHREVLRIIAKCHLRALDRGQDSAGPLFVQLSLDAVGRVLDLTMAEGFSPYVKSCAEPRLRDLVFAPGDGRLGMLRIPLTELSTESVDPAPDPE